MATRPPQPPPRGPQFTPPDGGSPLRTILKVVAYVIGGFVVLLVVGVGLLFATCAGLN